MSMDHLKTDGSQIKPARRVVRSLRDRARGDAPAKIERRVPNNNSTRFRANEPARLEKLRLKKVREREAAVAKQRERDLSFWERLGCSKEDIT
jgi:hypothetical protein